MSQKLTKRIVDAIQPPLKGTVFHFDTDVTGFGVRTSAGGAKTFIWQGRVDGRKQRLKIGRANGLTVEQARKVARQFAGEQASGRDPRAERHKRKAKSLPLSEAINEYLNARDLKSSTRAQVERVRETLRDWLPRPITTLTRDMVARRHRKLGETSPAYANLVMRLLRAILNFASEAHAYPDGKPLLVDNPVRVLSATKSWYRLAPRRSYLRPHELQKWIAAVDALGSVPERPLGAGKKLPKLRNGEIARDYLIFLLFTGLRRTEALELLWENVDFEARTVSIPDPKNRQEHTLPMSNFLQELLQNRRKLTSENFVFADRNGVRFTNLRYAFRRINSQSGLRVTCHDLRRTFATVAESLDIPAYAVQALLNHKTSGDVTAGYIQITPDRLRGPMERITEYLLKTGEIQGSASIESSTQPVFRSFRL